jgi:hypothetical protein
VASVTDNQIVVRKVEQDKETIIEERRFRPSEDLHLQVNVKNGKDISFFYSTDGKKFTLLNKQPIDGFFLPPWDRAVRVALFSRGEKSEKAVFDNFLLKNK